MTEPLEAEVIQALDEVRDPCSVAAGTPLSLVAMGLVRRCKISPDGEVEVVLDVTSPMCLMAGHFIADARERLSAIPGVSSATVRVEASGDWSPERITPPGQAALDVQRSRRPTGV